MGEVRILTANGPIATDGAFLDIGISSGAILHSVSVFPTDASIESTTVRSLLYSSDMQVAGIIPRDIASSNASIPQPAVAFPHTPLPEDKTFVLRTFINNATGASVNWRVTAIVEVV